MSACHRLVSHTLCPYVQWAAITRRARATRESVVAAAHPRYHALLLEFLIKRGSALSRRIQASTDLR